MNNQLNRLLILAAAVCAAAIFAISAQADPLPLRDKLKFDQEPMVNTAIQGQIYFGHDELSTAYGVGSTASPPLNYQGKFMADDFADNFSDPVVHVTWWGSYIDDNNAAFPPQPHVQKFLIAFESDVPKGPGQTFSQPGSVLQYDVVTAGPLAPQSGTFTETLVRGPDPVLGESLYKYNAELHLGHEFLEQKDTVYWLKIAALVDVPQPLVVPLPPGTTQWGWHNRDYTLNDPLASPVPSPGEFVDGVVPGTNIPIWHFQDDAVQGDLRFTPGAPVGSQIIQQNMLPQNYVFVNSTGVGPVDGPPGIEQHSKDLAFRLYTTQVPEPVSCVLVLSGAFGLALTRRRRS